MTTVFSQDFKRWAESIVGQETLGELMLQLIHESVPMSRIAYIRFLSRETNNLSGWDGILDVRVNHSFIPNGKSVWEMSGRTNPKGKIRNDYSDKLDNQLPDSWRRDETTYVAVSIRPIEKPEELEKELNEESPWKKVIIIDAVMLQDWVFYAPATESWLQEYGIGTPQTIRRLGVVWKSWCEQTSPNIIPKLLITGREKLASDIRTRLLDPKSVINIKSESPEEVIGFLYATVLQEDDELVEHLLARSIVVNNHSDIDRLETIGHHIVILIGKTTQLANQVAGYGHTVINALGHSSPSRKIDYKLNRSSRDSFKSVLMEMGIEEVEAGVQSRACGGSPAIWRVWNQLDTAVPVIPEWTEGGVPYILIPAVMLGAWSEKKPGDIEIVEQLTGLNYERYKESLEGLLTQNHPPLEMVGDLWSTTSPATTFAMLTPQITTGIMNRFSEVVNIVFSEIDPTIDLPPDERPYATLHNKEMKYSSWIRDGLAETVLRIAVLGHKLEEFGKIPSGMSSQNFVNHLVNRLPGLKTDWRVITSLSSQLPVLAEATPVPFFDALEELIQGDAEGLARIFEEGESGFGHSYHHNFLWALERLAWNPDYLMRASKILVELSKLDPGGRTVNRPMSSLREIFLPWKPDTAADVSRRRDIIEAIVSGEYEIGWAMLMELLPTNQGVSNPTNKPQWRDYGQTDRNMPSRIEIFSEYQWIISYALSQIGSDPDRLLEVIKRYADLTPELQVEFNLKISEFSSLGISGQNRSKIWTALRDLIYRHRSYKDAPWSMSDAVLSELESRLELFKPTESLDRVTWLFNDQYPSIPLPADDFDSIGSELLKLRSEAVGRIYHEGGVNGVIDLINNVQFVYLLAKPLVEVIDDPTIQVQLLSRTIIGNEKQQLFASGFSEECFKKDTTNWNSLVLKRSEVEKWSPETIARLFRFYPDTLDVYELIDSLGTEVVSAFWRMKYYIIRSKDSAVLQTGVRKLLDAGRYVDAIGQGIKVINLLETSEVFSIIDHAVDELNSSSDKHIGGNIAFHIEELFNWLRTQRGCTIEELAPREYAYLPILVHSYNKTKLSIHQLLAKDPEFFIQIICDLYKAHDGENLDEVQLSDSELEKLKARAGMAWKLLNSWTTPPGVDESGRVIRDDLFNWVHSVLSLAEARKRLDITIDHIGRILYYLPNSVLTEMWPCEELSELLEELKSTVLEDGVFIEMRNSRGGTSRGMFEGGAQERELAKYWEERLNAVEERWTRMRSLIQSFIASWELEAQRMDVEAEKNRIRFK